MSSSSSFVPSSTLSELPGQSTPAQGTLNSAGAGITGGYTGNSTNLKIIIAFLLGLSLYNAIELIVIVFVTFNRYKGLYFWSLIVAAFGVIPYSLGFLIKFFQLLDPNTKVGYVAVAVLTVGWYTMVTGQSVVLWSRLHLVTSSRRVINGTLYMIIIDAIIFHAPTTVLTFGSNSNSLPHSTLSHFVRGYNIMEKIQMVGFFLQELVISVIYIRETIRLLKLSASITKDSDEMAAVVDEGTLTSRGVRKTMYQLIAINTIIIAMDIALLGVEFANLYLIETTLKGVVYSIKLKLEFAVLSKLVQLVRTNGSSGRGESVSGSAERRGTVTGCAMEKSCSGGIPACLNGRVNGSGAYHWPDFVDPTQFNSDVTHAGPSRTERERWRRRTLRFQRNSWIDEEMDKHNIG